VALRDLFKWESRPAADLMRPVRVLLAVALAVLTPFALVLLVAVAWALLRALLL